MTSNSEIVAILSGGVSFRRLMWPYFLGSTVVALVSLGFNHYVIPKTNMKRLKFEHAYVGSSRPNRTLVGKCKRMFWMYLILITGQNVRSYESGTLGSLFSFVVNVLDQKQKGTTMSLAEIQSGITQAAQLRGRDSASVTLLAVSKVQPNDRVQSVLE